MSRVLTALCASLMLTSCEYTDPTQPEVDALDVSSLSQSNRATATRVDWGPEPLVINPPAPCLGGNVLITGTISGWDLFVERPDGSLHLTEYFTMTDLVASFGGATWDAAPGSHEIWSANFPPDAPLFPIAAQQLTHAGSTVFRSDDGGPDLRFVHQIHLVRLPDGELQILRSVFEVQCVGPAV